MIAELSTLQRFPTVASNPAALRAAADWLRHRLDRLGFRTIPGSAVVAERRGAPGAPTFLIYGHYDVVPAGPGWSVPPFAAVRRGSTLWGRGASDDKGPIAAILHALRLPSRASVKIVFEGAEESGSPGLAATVDALRGWLGDVDAIVICDTEARPDGRPTLTTQLRGDLSARLRMWASGRPLHSGRYGGAAPDPARALAVALASLFRPDGSVAVPGFYQGVVPGGRFTTRPAVTVTGLRAGSSHSTIPAHATAELDVRLVPGQRPRRIADLLRAHVAALPLRGMRFRLDPLVSVPPWRLTSHPMIGPARAAVARTWGVTPAMVRSGGSMPAVPLLAGAVPRAAMVLLGFALPSDNAHGPDEHVDLNRLRRAAVTIGELLGSPGHGQLGKPAHDQPLAAPQFVRRNGQIQSWYPAE